MKPHFIIYHGSKPYLRRWHLLPRNRWFSIYLHHFLQSDDLRALHDHPYDNMSFLLKGFYTEINDRGRRTVRRFHVVFRRAGDPHRIELIGGRPVWSLFFCGRRKRTWGFHCPNGWVPYDEYLKMVPGGDEIGKGCD